MSSPLRKRGVGMVAVVAVTLIRCGVGYTNGGNEATTSATSALAISLTNEVGRLVSSGNGQRRTFFAYDARGRTVHAQHLLGTSSYTFSTGYGFPCASDGCTTTQLAANGPAVVAQNFSDGEMVHYTYDLSGAQQAITTSPTDGGAAQVVVAKILRNARGQTTEVDYGDGTVTTHAYNDASDLRLRQLQTLHGPAVLQLFQYSFDGNGNVTGVLDYCNEAAVGACSASSSNTTYSTTYQYNSLNELTQATRNGVAVSYVYDATGNLTQKEGVSQAYFPSGAGNPRPHALSAVGAVAYAYDANGNMTGTSGAATNVAVTWNAENMPVQLAYGAAKTTKAFVGEAMWRKVQGATTTTYLPSMRLENGLARKFFGSFAERDTDGSLKFYHGDHLGSSTLVTDASGNVVHRQAYKPYGEDIVAVAPGPFTPKFQFDFKEKEADGTGFYDYGARLYNPATGRWLSADSSTRDGLNRYAYVRNNPLFYVDPTGHSVWDALINWIKGEPPPPPAAPATPKVPNMGVPSGPGQKPSATPNPPSAGFKDGRVIGGLLPSNTQAGPGIDKVIARNTEKRDNNSAVGDCASAALQNAAQAEVLGLPYRIWVLGDANNQDATHAVTEVDVPTAQGGVQAKYLSWGQSFDHASEIMAVGQIWGPYTSAQFADEFVASGQRFIGPEYGPRADTQGLIQPTGSGPPQYSPLNNLVPTE